MLGSDVCRGAVAPAPGLVTHAGIGQYSVERFRVQDCRRTAAGWLTVRPVTIHTHVIRRQDEVSLAPVGYALASEDAERIGMLHLHPYCIFEASASIRGQPSFTLAHMPLRVMQALTTLHASPQQGPARTHPSVSGCMCFVLN